MAYLDEHAPMRELWRMTATICRTIAQVNGVKARLEDFLPYPVEQTPLTAEQLKARFMAVLPPTKS
jgi:hypothetical protein